MAEALSPIVNFLARLGHFSLGVVHLTLGIMVWLLALGFPIQSPDFGGTIRFIKSQPFGPVVLVALLAGLLSLTAWRLLQIIFDLEGHGRTAWGKCLRGRYIFGAAIYSFMAFAISRSLAGAELPPGEVLVRSTARTVAWWAEGTFILALAGGGFAVSAIYYTYRAARANFEGMFEKDRMTTAQYLWSFRCGRAGCASRAVILAIIAFFFISAGVSYNPDGVAGYSGAVHALLRQPLGRLFVAGVAIGLMAWGVFLISAMMFGRPCKPRPANSVLIPSNAG